jgi:hypothetical protein
MTKKIYLITRESRSEGPNTGYVNETAFSKKEYAVDFLKKIGVKEDFDEHIEIFELDKLKDADGFWCITFEASQCKEDLVHWESQIEENRFQETDCFNVNTPLGNRIFYRISKEICFIEQEVYMYDYPLSLEVKSFEKTKQKALKDAFNKAKIWINKKKKEKTVCDELIIDSATNWLNEELRWRRLTF